MANLTPTEKAFIAGNHAAKTVPDIAKHLKRGAATIYAYYAANFLKPYKDPNALKRPNSHPFRRQNRKLETYLAACQVERNAPEVKKEIISRKTRGRGR